MGGGEAKLLGDVFEGGDGRKKAVVVLPLRRAPYGRRGWHRNSLRALCLCEKVKGKRGEN